MIPVRDHYVAGERPDWLQPEAGSSTKQADWRQARPGMAPQQRKAFRRARRAYCRQVHPMATYTLRARMRNAIRASRAVLNDDPFIAPVVALLTVAAIGILIGRAGGFLP